MEEKASFWRRRLKEFRLRRLRNLGVNLICALILLGTLAWLGEFFLRHHRYEITNDAIIDQYIVPVSVRVSGYIKDVNFREHQRVKKGDVLITIDDSEFKVRRDDAVAALMDAESALDVLEAEIEASKKYIDAAQSNIDETKVHTGQLEADAKRYEQLLEDKAVSSQVYEQSLSALNAGRAKLVSLEKQKDALEARHKSDLSRVKGAKALILRRKADLTLAELDLSYTKICAPYDGYMGRRSIERGEYVSTGQAVANFVDDEEKWITANYKETQIASLHVGQSVKISVDAFPDMVLDGKISAISVATGSKYSMLPIDNSAGNFVKIRQRIPVRIDFENVPAETLALLRAGMMAEAAAVK